MPDLPEVPEEPTKEPAEALDEALLDDALVDAADGPAADAAEQPPGATDDELFARLVAGFDDPVEAADRSWPAAEDVADLAPQTRPRPAEPLVRLPRIQAIPPVDPRAWTPAEDPDEDHYVPPPPPPLPRTEAPTRLAIVALVGGMVLFLVSAIGYLPELGGMGELLGIAFFIGGVGTLFARMRTGDDDDDHDDPQRGAVV
ncbi:hypothetical protein [Streptacidiphilus cavernicola]|uniref:DUF308 domain-containing protein n=1 Tax=Streptacidiphilus cavernicola TaxID=3342716 RepID=A0ABV6VT88_9ACTN